MSKGVSGDVEISWYFVDNYSTLDSAPLLVFESLLEKFQNGLMIMLIALLYLLNL